MYYIIIIHIISDSVLVYVKVIQGSSPTTFSYAFIAYSEQNMTNFLANFYISGFAEYEYQHGSGRVTQSRCALRLYLANPKKDK